MPRDPQTEWRRESREARKTATTAFEQWAAALAVRPVYPPTEVDFEIANGIREIMETGTRAKLGDGTLELDTIATLERQVRDLFAKWGQPVAVQPKRKRPPTGRIVEQPRPPRDPIRDGPL